MKTIDRIPETYRAAVLLAMDQAGKRVYGPAYAANVGEAEEKCRVAGEAEDNARGAVLARYLKIADEADAAASRQYAATQAGGGYAPFDATPDGMHVVCKASADAARAKVWADEIAKLDAEHGEHHDCPACTVQTAAMHQRDADAGAGWDPIGGRPVAPDLPGAASFVGTVQTEARLDIHDAGGLRVALDGLARYLAEPRDGLPVELTLNVIRLLALSLPRGPLAPAEHQAQTLAALAALVKTIPGNRWPGSSPRLDLATWDAASVARVAALPKAHGFSMPYEQQQMVDVAIASVDGLEVKAQHRRPMTDAERLGLGGGS